MSITISATSDGRVEKECGPGALPRIDVFHKQGNASISLYGGHLLGWHPAGHYPVFWLSRDSAFGYGEPIRGGIPVCWPWFGRIESVGNHGFVRELLWGLSGVRIEEAGVWLKLCLSGGQESEFWPHAFQVVQHIFIGGTLDQRFEMINKGTDVALCSGALHSYFGVSHVDNVEIPRLIDLPYQDKYRNLSWNRSADPIPFSDGVDRIYHTDESLTIFDHGSKRKISIEKHGSEQWVLWNPGAERVSQFPDIHSGGQVEFVCLEVAATEPREIGPGKSMCFGQIINVAHVD